MKPMKPAQRSRWIRVGRIDRRSARRVVSCKYKKHADGEVSRNWTPPQQEQYMGVPAAEVQAAIQRRLGRGAADAGDGRRVEARQEALRQLRPESAVARRQGSASTARARAAQRARQRRQRRVPTRRLSARRARVASLGAVDATSRRPTSWPTPTSCCRRRSPRSARQLLTGQVKPASLGQAWHINPLEERVDSALALHAARRRSRRRARANASAGSGVRLAAHAARRACDMRSRAGGWPTVPAGRRSSRGDDDSPRGWPRCALDCAPRGISPDSASRRRVALRSRARRAVARLPGAPQHRGDSMLGKETVDAMNVPAAISTRADRGEPRALSLDAALARQPVHHRQRARSSSSRRTTAARKRSR